MGTPQLADLVLETANAPGTGAFTLNGAPEGRQTFADAFPNGGDVYYYASDGTQSEWGVGTLTVGTPNTLVRKTIIGNLFGSTSALNFTASVTIWNEAPARAVALRDDNNQLPVPASQDFSQDVALSAKAAEDRYLKSYTDGTDEAIARMVFRPSVGAPFIDGFPGGPFFFQKNGDYAANSALAAETTAREAAISSLSDSKANIGGGNQFLGQQSVAQGGIELIGNTAMGTASYQLAIQRGDAWRFGIDYTHDANNGNYSRQIYYDGDTNNVLDILYYFVERGRLSSQQKGDFALVSDLPYAQANIKLQMWTATQTGDGGLQKLPAAFSQLLGVSATQIGTIGNSYGNIQIEAVDGASFRMHNAGNNAAFCIAWGIY